jgi:hypothetical protein
MLKRLERALLTYKQTQINGDKRLSFLRLFQSVWKIKNAGYIKLLKSHLFPAIERNLRMDDSAVNKTDNLHRKQLTSVSYSFDYPCLYDVRAAREVGVLDYGQIRNELKVRGRG